MNSRLCAPYTYFHEFHYHHNATDSQPLDHIHQFKILCETNLKNLKPRDGLKIGLAGQQFSLIHLSHAQNKEEC
jgi:hypothetical protein